MRFYNSNHQFYCGIDLHARVLAVCVLDQVGNIVLQTQIPADKKMLLSLLAPFRPDVVVAVECLFAWYWVADLCQAEKIPFVLGHALYMKAIHGGKSKNDDIDAEKISRLLRGGNIPVAYVYPKGLRETRDLLRRRMVVHLEPALPRAAELDGLTEASQGRTRPRQLKKACPLGPSLLTGGGSHEASMRQSSRPRNA
jgi:hypothetical protein